MNGNFCSLFSTFLALECCCPASPPALTQWTVLSAGAGYVCPPRPWAGGSRVARTRRRTRLTVPDHAAEWRGRTRCGCAQSERDRNPGSWCTGLFPEPGHRSQGQKDEFTVQQVARTFPEEGMRCERNRLGGAHVEGLGAAASAPGWGGWAGARAGATASRSLRAKRPWRGRDVGGEGGSRAGATPASLGRLCSATRTLSTRALRPRRETPDSAPGTEGAPRASGTGSSFPHRSCAHITPPQRPPLRTRVRILYIFRTI